MHGNGGLKLPKLDNRLVFKPKMWDICPRKILKY